MIIIKNTGGIGNQMFIYALYTHLKKNNICKIDDLSFKLNQGHEQTKITNIFSGIEVDLASIEEISTIADDSSFLINKIRRKFLGHYKTHLKHHHLTYIDLDDIIGKNIYLDGYWQSEKFFFGSFDEVRKNFIFPQIKMDNNLNLLKDIEQSNSVSIHVRKGKDYQSSSFSNICDLEYYSKAILEIKNRINNPIFFVFSDNFDWCKDNLISKYDEMKFIDWNPSSGDLCYLDMQLMSNCKHNIIANSSYSWWAAWLNRNPNKLVITPNTWISKTSLQHSINDIIPEGWIKI